MAEPSSAHKASDKLPDLQTLVGRNWVSLGQACDLIEISYQTGMRYIRPGKDKLGKETPPKLKAVRVGGTWRIYEEELRRFLDAGNQ